MAPPIFQKPPGLAPGTPEPIQPQREIKPSRLPEPEVPNHPPTPNAIPGHPLPEITPGMPLPELPPDT